MHLQSRSGRLIREDALDTRNHLAASRAFLSDEVTDAPGADSVSARSECHHTHVVVIADGALSFEAGGVGVDVGVGAIPLEFADGKPVMINLSVSHLKIFETGRDQCGLNVSNNSEIDGMTITIQPIFHFVDVISSI